MFRYVRDPASWLSASTFNVKGHRFRPFRFKFRPKRSDFGRKKLRTAETGFGFRLSEVIPYLGERGAALGGLQGAELENGFYPYSGWNSRNAPSAAAMFARIAAGINHLFFGGRFSITRVLLYNIRLYYCNTLY